MNIIIVDDDAFVSASLKIILESYSDITVLATGANGHDAISLYDTYIPDVLLMDIRMESMDGLTASKEIITGHPDAKILLLTTFADDDYIIKAIRTGAKGYILKQDFETWGRGMVLLFPDEEQYKKFQPTEFPGLPSTIIYGIDADGNIQKQITESMKLSSSAALPVFIIADTFNRVVFVSQGYTIGLGEQLMKVVYGL